MADHRVHPHLVVMHWAMALCVVAAVGAILARAELPAGHAWRAPLRQLHLALGQLVLALVAVRIALRLWHGMPPAIGVGRFARWAGHAVHGAMYAVMLSQPVTGILLLQAGGKSVVVLGWTLPGLVADDAVLHSQLKEAHQTIGLLFYALLGLHVGAALMHHFFLRNHTLRRMLQLRPAPGTAAAADAAPAHPYRSTP